MGVGEVSMLVELERAARRRRRRRLVAAVMLGASITAIVAAVVAILWGMIPREARLYGLLLGAAAGVLLAAAYYLSEPAPPRLDEVVVEAVPLGEAELSPSEAALLEALRRHGWRAKVGVLAEEAGLDPGDVLPLLAEMEAKGAVRLVAAML